MPPKKQPWFRFYVEAIWDRKLRRLPVSTRWLWVVVLACARSSPVPGHLLLTEGDAMNVADLADAAAMSEKDVRKGLESLTTIGLINKDANTCALFVTRWNERQFQSDEVSLRTARHRSKERSMERSNADDGTHQIQRQITEDPPNPPRAGGSRADGTSPRQRQKQREIDELLDKINACNECGDNPNVFCDRCTGLRRRLGELVA